MESHHAADQLSVSLNLKRNGFVLDASLEAPARTVTAVFGPSGAGKTTLLRCIAGLETAARGTVRVGAEQWQHSDTSLFVPPHRRAVGFVFQDTRLFPHLSVQANLDYARRRSRSPASAATFNHTVDLLGLAHLLHRRAHQLSGGEQRRAAIARALLTQPRLLLLDEPLAGLDLKRRDEIMPYLRQLRHELALPMLLVSHALDEIARFADGLVLIESGRTIAQGPLAHMLCRLDLPLAHTEGGYSVIETRVVEHQSKGGARLGFDGGELYLSADHRAPPTGRPARVMIAARDVSVALSPARDSSIANILPAVIQALGSELGAEVNVCLGMGEARLLARLPRPSCTRLGLHEGQHVYAQIHSLILAD